MKHLNPELEKLEQRVAPSLGLPDISIGIGVNVSGGTGSCCSSTCSSSSSG